MRQKAGQLTQTLRQQAAQKTPVSLKQHLRDLLEFMRYVGKRFKAERCSQIASSLTFTTLLSLVPLITIGLTVFSTFPVFEDLSIHIKEYLLTSLMPETAGSIIIYVQQFVDSATRLTTIGIIVLMFTAMVTMLTIDRAFNIIWKTTTPRKLVNRLVIYWAMLTLGPILIGLSLSLTSWIISLSTDYAKHIPLIGTSALKILPLSLVALAFALLFRIMPNRHVPVKNALIGATVAAFAFEVMSFSFGYYIRHFNNYALVYGAFSTIPIFLLWIFLSWMSVIFGAVVTASLSNWRVPRSGKQTQADYLLHSLRILQMLYQHFQQGNPVVFTDMARQLRIDYDTQELLLMRLKKARMASPTGRNSWILSRSPARIQTNELLKLFILDPRLAQTAEDSSPVNVWMANFVQQLQQNTNITLQQLFEQSQPATGTPAEEGQRTRRYNNLSLNDLMRQARSPLRSSDTDQQATDAAPPQAGTS